MSPLRFSFVLHIHQPVGNFDFVFREHADDVYRPFFDFLDERSLWPVGLHVSGPLLEWLERHDTRLHDRIGRMASDGLVELLSAGWYEPILASLGPRDRATQLEWMRNELASRFGVSPRGLWLTERVWTPPLAQDLANAGVEYALVDDHLLRRAGAGHAELLRPSRAEYQGESVALFAIDEGLRYLIPFKAADQVGAELRRRHQSGDPLALFADDGEKFGGWPRTREWLYDQGWLRAFGDQMDDLRSEDVVRLVTPGVALDELGPGPTFELPEGSYPEMDEWAGGPWMNFLDRYTEAGRLHTWMTLLSDACARAGDLPEVRRAVGRAQCNDPYWHGVFGGLYMKHLREGVRDQMVVAERLLRRGQELAWEGVRERDGSAAHWVHSGRLSARVVGAAGGSLSELVWLDPHVDVGDVLTRRLEAYHHEAVARGVERQEAAHDAQDASQSIHEIEAAATLRELPPTDPDMRLLIRDRVLPAGLTLAEYQTGDFTAVWGAVDVRLAAPERIRGPNQALRWHFSPSGPALPGVVKTLRISEGDVQIEWRWNPTHFPADASFAPELSLGAPVGLTFDPEPNEVWRYPIVTVSKCPDGFEEIEQGTSVTPRWPTRFGWARVTLTPLGS